MRWLTLAWYRYLFAPLSGDQHPWKTLKCRYQGHTKGVIWYNTGGLEPNMHCVRCGDDLG